MLAPNISSPSAMNATSSKTNSVRGSSFKNNSFNQTLAIQKLNQAEKAEFVASTKPSLQRAAVNPVEYDAGQTANRQGQQVVEEKEDPLYYPDEIRYGRKRPPLPHTFGFGLRRPTTVPLAMRFSIIEGERPQTEQAAIAATFDLAATNSHPYTKGQRLSLYV